MSEQENRDTMERYRQEYLERQNIDAVDDLMHDDYVEEYPNQARGSAARTAREPCMRAIQDYDGHRMNVCEIVEVEHGKIKRDKGYFAEPFEAPERRAQWVERF